MSPEEAGQIVVRGIEADRLYILTHPEMWPVVEARYRAMKTDFEAAMRDKTDATF
jgi:hypothetical protein